jgi:radical SAM superfamily enzyme YgiQ (UPF0313 family)
MSKNNNNLLLIIPGFFYIEEYQKLLYYNDIPLGTLQLSSFLRERAHIKTQIVDLRVEQENYPNLAIEEPNKNQFEDSLLKCLEENDIQNFQNIGINCYTSYQYLQTDLIAKIVKQEFPKKTIIVGGYHPTAVPKDFKRTCFRNSPFDFVIRGEAELPLLELLESHHLKPNKKTKIINSNGCIDINILPFPDYILYLEQYPYKDKFKFEYFMSRGCPYQCAFCAQNYDFRTFTFQKFKQDFDYLCRIVEQYNKNTLKIAFADQSFNRVSISNKVLNYLIQNSLHERFSFSCQSRVESFKDRADLIKKHQACKMVIGFGFESASKKLLPEMHKTENSKEYIETMKYILNFYKDSNDTYCRLNLLAGFPGEDQKTFNETIEFVNTYALHENIQISPTLFSNYPNVFVYKNMNYYKRKYGSKFIKKWWKLPSNSFKNSVPEKTSKSYTKKQLIGDYKDKYFEVLKLWKREMFAELVHWKKFFNKWYEEL